MILNYYHIFIGLLGILVFLDIISLALIKKQKRTGRIPGWKLFIFTLFLYLSILFTLILFAYPIIKGLPQISGERMRAYFTMFGLIFLFQIPKLLYQLFWLAERAFIKLIKVKVISNSGLFISAIFFEGIRHFCICFYECWL